MRVGGWPGGRPLRWGAGRVGSHAGGWAVCGWAATQVGGWPGGRPRRWVGGMWVGGHSGGWLAGWAATQVGGRYVGGRPLRWVGGMRVGVQLCLYVPVYVQHGVSTGHLNAVSTQPPAEEHDSMANTASMDMWPATSYHGGA